VGGARAVDALRERRASSASSRVEYNVRVLEMSIFGALPFTITAPTQLSTLGRSNEAPVTTVFQDRIVLNPIVVENPATSLAFFSDSTTNRVDPEGNLDLRSANDAAFDLPLL
jgi:hypothetical protein